MSWRGCRMEDSGTAAEMCIRDRVEAGHDFDQRGLPRAVLTDHSVDRAGVQGEVCVPERHYGPEALGAVSYTHLDVYKRQPTERSMSPVIITGAMASEMNRIGVMSKSR